MLLVCKEHVTKGLRLLTVPHIKEMPEETKKSCSFCNQQAKFKLFLSNSTSYLVIPKEEKENRGISDTLVLSVGH